jgi:ferredoxin
MGNAGHLSERGIAVALRVARRLAAAGPALRADLAFVARSLRGDGPSPVLRSGRRAARPGDVPPPVAERPLASVSAPVDSAGAVEIVPGGPADALARARAGVTLRIRIAGREAALVTPGHQPILDVALAAGLPMPSSCRAGGCGACKVRLVEGRVALPAGHCLDAAELAAGEILTCVGCALTDLTVEVPS